MVWAEKCAKLWWICFGYSLNQHMYLSVLKTIPSLIALVITFYVCTAYHIVLARSHSKGSNCSQFPVGFFYSGVVGKRETT